MALSQDITSIVAHYTWAWRAPTRTNWREGSSIIDIVRSDPWWQDFVTSLDMNQAALIRAVGYYRSPYTSWVDWCEDKLIIGPPRARSERERTGFDESYMTDEDFERHYVPWANTWPDPDDHSWCEVRDVPDWAKAEFLRSRNS